MQAPQRVDLPENIFWQVGTVQWQKIHWTYSIQVSKEPSYWWTRQKIKTKFVHFVRSAF
jgi:hypothetical protein